MVGAVVTAIRPVLDWATNLHWVIGIVLATVIIICAAVWLLLAWRQKTGTSFFGIYRVSIAINLGIIVIVAMIAMAGISNTLFHKDLVQYDLKIQIPAASEDSTITIEERTDARFLDFYGWHFGWHFIDSIPDSIPVVEAWRAFDVDPPIEGHGFW